jgi:hypothetical protein
MYWVLQDLHVVNTLVRYSWHAYFSGLNVGFQCGLNSTDFWVIEFRFLLVHDDGVVCKNKDQVSSMNNLSINHFTTHALYVCLCAIVVLASGCESSGRRSSKADTTGTDPTDPSTSDANSVTVTIGAEGGELVFGSGASSVILQIPPGALETDVEITATAAEPRDRVSSIVNFSPSGLIFGEPATISFGNNSLESTGRATVVYTDSTGAFYPIESSISAGGGIQAEITHFSSYGVIETSDGYSLCTASRDGTWGAFCTKYGNAGPLQWGISEFGVDGPSCIVSVNLLNTTRDLVYVTATSTTQDNFFGGGISIKSWHVPEIDYFLSSSRDLRAEMNDTPMRKYLKGSPIKDYYPYSGLSSGFLHQDPAVGASFEVCFDWVQFNIDGVVDQGSGCATYAADPKEQPTDNVTWTSVNDGSQLDCSTNCQIYTCAEDQSTCCDLCGDDNPGYCPIPANAWGAETGSWLCPGGFE